MILQWKSGAQLENDTEIGKVFVYDDDGDPDDLLEEVRWTTEAEAKKYAEERGYEYEEI